MACRITYRAAIIKMGGMKRLESERQRRLHVTEAVRNVLTCWGGRQAYINFTDASCSCICIMQSQRLVLRAVFLRKSLPGAEQRFPLKCVFSGSAAKCCHIFVSRCAASAAFSVGAATAAVAENLAAAIVSNVSLYVETM